MIKRAKREKIMEKGKDKTIIIFLSIVRPTMKLNSKNIGNSRVNNFKNRFIRGLYFLSSISAIYVNDPITPVSGIAWSVAECNPLHAVVRFNIFIEARTDILLLDVLLESALYGYLATFRFSYQNLIDYVFQQTG